MQPIDPNRQYGVGDLPYDVFNAGNGDIKNYNGQNVRVQVNNNNTRNLSTEGVDNEVQRKYAMEAVQPAINSLEASLPEISAKFKSAQDQVSAEKQPLKDRYDQLLNEIRGRETSQVNDTTKTANREFARRGITADSTFAAEETQGRTAPIRSAAQSDILTTTFDRESKLREIDNTITNLTQDMITAERDVRNTIANIQATAGTEAANRAFEMYKIQRQEQQSALDRALTARTVTAAETTANAKANETSTQIVTQNGRQLLIDSRTGATIRDIGPSGTGTGTTANISTYLNPSTTPSSFKPTITNFGSAGGNVYDIKGNLTSTGKSYYGL